MGSGSGDKLFSEPKSRTQILTHGGAFEAALAGYEAVNLCTFWLSQVVYEIAGGKEGSLAILPAFAYLNRLKRFLRDPVRCEHDRVDLGLTVCFGRSYDQLRARQTRWDTHRRR